MTGLPVMSNHPFYHIQAYRLPQTPCCTHPDSQTVMYVIILHPKPLNIIIISIYHWNICHIVTVAICVH